MPETSAASQTGLTGIEFEHEVRDALARLHDPGHLQAHPLTRFLRADASTRQASLGRALRQALLDAIESLKPTGEVSASSHAYRTYQGLRLRYVEGLDVSQVLDRLAVSKSVYYVEQQRAVEAVTSLLRQKWGLARSSQSPGHRSQPSEPRELRDDASAAADRRAPAAIPRQETPNNLPVQLTSFVGREHEISEVRRLLGTTRLLTLRGTGGCGKTRLAYQVVADLLDAYPDGVWVVELAPLSDPDLVTLTVAQTLGLREAPGLPIANTLQNYLKPRQLLLLLENCEHLIAECARVTEEILRACPSLQILATSREALGVPGELSWRVPSLSTPSSELSEALDLIATCEAVRLFVERARLVAPSFTLTESNVPFVAQVCQRLDGIPLAIELAAARLRVLTPEQIAQRLDSQFQLLTGGGRTAPLRQRTLKATLDWSHDLLAAPERQFLRRLAVFAGGFTLEAAEVVCSGDGIEEADILDLLTQLADRSLVQVEAREGQSRYRLLEPIRQYAWALLLQSGEPESLQRRHANWCLDLAERAEPELHGPEQKAWLDRLTVEHDNLRGALAWCQERDPAAGLRLAASLWPFWEVRCHYREGRHWLEALLERAPEATPARAKALLGAGWIASCQWDEPAAATILEASLRLCEQLGDRRGAAWAMVRLGHLDRFDVRGTFERLTEDSLTIFREVGDLRGIGEALALEGSLSRTDRESAFLQESAPLQESLSYFRKAGDVSRSIWVLSRLGVAAHGAGDCDRARALLEEGLSLARGVGDRQLVGRNLGDLGNVAISQGAYQEASALLEQSLAIIRDIGDELFRLWVGLHLGNLRRIECDFQSARMVLEECLALSPEGRGYSFRGLALASLGTLASAQGRNDEAASLFRKSLAFWLEPDVQSSWHGQHCLWLSGVFEAKRQQWEQGVRQIASAEARGAPDGTLLYPPDRAARDAALAAARTALGEEAFARAWAEGQEMTLEQAVEYALRGATDA